MISGTGMAVSLKTSRMEMEQRMRKAVQEEEALRMMGVGWVMKVLLEVEVQGVEGVLWEGDESLLAEVQECASLLLVCRCTVSVSQKRAQEEAPNTTRSRQTTCFTIFTVFCLFVCFFYLGSRSQPTPISLLSKATCGLFCVDIKYFSLSSNSLF